MFTSDGSEMLGGGSIMKRVLLSAIRWIYCLGTIFGIATMTMGQESDPPKDAPESQVDWNFWKLPELGNVPMKTMGGRQFWGDRFFHSGWRIQKNVIDDHHRLLDPNDYRHAYGTYEDCLKKFREIKREQSIPPMSGKAVIFIHGIIRSSKSFASMAEHFQKRGWTSVGFDYPSTRVSLEESAKYLHEVIESLEGIEEIDLVVHSMGGLVVRTYLAEHEPDPRIHRMVMMGTPNSGSPLATILQSNLLYQTVAGPAGQKLGTDHEEILSLPIPKFEFGIVAGGRGDETGFNPLIPGDDDGTVSVESAKLEGARDLLVVPILHSFLMMKPDAISAVERFLETGAFNESGDRKPVATDQ